jgi:inosine-uridine nucleoside N-ribohydrolase
MAVATLIDSSIVTTTPLHVDVETSRGSIAYGMTLCDGRGLGNDLMPRGTGRHDASEPNADVAVAVDESRFWDLLFEGIASYA